MQKSQKPAIRLPEGSHRFGAILESPGKPEPTEIRTFLLRAHEYGEEKLERTLKSVMCRSQREIASETSDLISNSEKILFNPADAITDIAGLAEAANGIILGRNALIPHYLSTEPFVNYFFRPYQELCGAAVSEENPDSKGEYIRVLGVLGNLLPGGEKAKLGLFLVDFMKAEREPWSKLAAIEALANLLCARAAGPIAEAAEATEDRTLENAAFKASMVISIVSAPNSMQGILARFLFGDYSAEAKLGTAFLMRSMKSALLEANLALYLSDVQNTVRELKAHAVAIGVQGGGTLEEMSISTNHYLQRFYGESRFINDILAYSELALDSGPGGRC